jgi:hypothetical protein
MEKIIAVSIVIVIVAFASGYAFTIWKGHEHRRSR